MSTRVTYTDKAGRECSAVYPNEKMAAMFARTVRNARLETCDVAAHAVEVRACPVGTAELQRAATARHYETDEQQALREAREGRALDAGHSYEREAEFWAESRVAGQSSADAWADHDYLKGRGAL